MRKELLVYVPTFEKGEEISVTSVAINRSFVLINTPNGRVTANREELLNALLEIEVFDKIHNSKEENLVALNIVPQILDVEYTED